MFFSYLPAPLYITIAIVMTLGLSFIVIRGRTRKDPYIYTGFGVSFIVVGIASAIQRILHSYLINYEVYAVIFEKIAIVATIVGAVLGFVGGIKYGDKKRKQIAIWGGIYCVILFAIFWFTTR